MKNKEEELERKSYEQELEKLKEEYKLTMKRINTMKKTIIAFLFIYSTMIILTLIFM